MRWWPVRRRRVIVFARLHDKHGRVIADTWTVFVVRRVLSWGYRPAPVPGIRGGRAHPLRPIRRRFGSLARST